MRIRIIILMLFVFLCCQALNAQGLNLTASLGLGKISSRSASQSTLDMGLILGLNSPLDEAFDVNFGYTFAKRIEYFLPENRTGRVYPYFHILYFSAEGHTNNGAFEFVYHLGPSMIYDAMFEDEKHWTFGIIGGGGLTLSGLREKGIIFGIILNYGLGFGPDGTGYYSASLRFGYEI